jgi:glycosyltransferase involved in cell wall biosynthesis
MRQIAGSSFALVANGYPGEPPMSPICDALLALGASRVTCVYHPLDSGDQAAHQIDHHDGGRIRRRRLRLPSKTPLTYPLDLLVPPFLPRVDGWIGFNNLLALQGLGARRIGRADRVAYSAVDFVPERFGPGRLTALYDALDRFACRAADVRFEVSDAALVGRNARHGLDGASHAPAHVMPIGVWPDRVPRTDVDGHRERRIVYAGHLVPRQGVGVLVDALSLLAEAGVPFTAQIAGDGPEAETLRRHAAERGLGDRVAFLGYLSPDGDVQRFLATGTIAAAPYATDPNSFTRYADPSKLKAYAAAGLPIVTTDVPPNARELERLGAAQVVDDTAPALAGALQRLLDDASLWSASREASLAYAARFDWISLTRDALAAMGFYSEANAPQTVSA